MTFMYTLHRLKFGLQFCPRGQVCDYIEVQMPPHSLNETQSDIHLLVFRHLCIYSLFSHIIDIICIYTATCIA